MLLETTLIVLVQNVKCDLVTDVPLKFIDSGETIFPHGEYSDDTTDSCCGDDDNEYFIFWDDNYLRLDKTACCSSPTHCVDLTDECRPYQYETGALCGDGIDNDCDGLYDCDDNSCTCGTPGSGPEFCNGIGVNNTALHPLGGYYGSTYVDSSKLFYPLNEDYCSDVSGVFLPCLNRDGFRNGETKCGSSDIGIFGVCDTSGTECVNLDVTDFEAEVVGDYFCPLEESFVHGDTIKIDISFDPATYNWDYLAECEIIVGPFSEFTTIKWTNDGTFDLSGNPIQLEYTFNDLVFQPPLVPGAKVDVDVECYIYTDYYDSNGWIVSDVVIEEAVIIPVCDGMCLINDIFMDDGIANSSDEVLGHLPCYYCNTTFDQFDWTLRSDGERCYGRTSHGHCEVGDDNCAGLCCNNDCTTTYMGRFTIEEGQEEDSPQGLALGQSCIFRGKAGLLLCERNNTICNESVCIDDDEFDLLWDLDSDGTKETADVYVCDSHEDCNSTDPTLGCSPRCQCEKMPKCWINGEAYYNGHINSLNPCEVCDITVSAWNWSRLDIGSGCGEWKCSDDLTDYTTAGDGIFAVKGACAINTTDEIECIGISEHFCSDPEIDDFGHGTQVLPCEAECDSIYDINSSGNVCRCDDSIYGICIDTCTWTPDCQGINILGLEFFCGERDLVCPEIFKDPVTGISPDCSTISSCLDPDCP